MIMKMALRLGHCLVVLLISILLCSGSVSAAIISNGSVLPLITDRWDSQIKNPPVSVQLEDPVIRNNGTPVQATTKLLYRIQPSELPERDVTTPTTTIPVINPSSTPNTPSTNPTVTTNPTYSTPTPTPTTMTPITTPYTTTTPTSTTPYTTPTSTTPTTTTPTSSGGQSWCIASQSASQTALQVALDYACGYGGADCSAIQQGGNCFNPDTVKDHASYAFNSYYQKNPVPTSCDFGGTAVLTSVDPSTGSCQFPSTSTSSSVLNTSNPVSSGSTVYGYDEPPPSYSGTSTQNCITFIIGLMCLILSSVSLYQT